MVGLMRRRRGIDCEAAISALNVARSKFWIEHNGRMLKVTNLFDTNGTEIFVPTDRLFSCVAYDDHATSGHWLTLSPISCDEIRSPHAEEISDQGCAKRN